MRRSKATPEQERARRLRLKRRSALFLRRLAALAFIVAGGELIRFRGGAASYLLFWSALIVPLYSAVWRIVIGRRFYAAMRADAPSALRGERYPCTLLLVNDSPLPIPEIRIRMSGGRVAFDEAWIKGVSLAPGEVRMIDFSPLCLHCGKTELGAAEIILRDPFALSFKELSALETLRIKPRLMRLSRLSVTEVQERVERRAAPTYMGERTPSGELRLYQPGDDVRRVHWKQSALQGRPILRATEPESRDEVVLLPDLRKTLPDGEEGFLAEDSIREGSLALADWFLRRNMAIRVLPDEHRAITVRTGRELSRLRELLNGDCFTGERRPDEMMERDLAAGHPVRRYILLTWEVDEALLLRAVRCISLGARVTLLCVGGGEELKARAGTVRQLEFHQITAKRDIFAVLSGGEGETP